MLADDRHHSSSRNARLAVSRRARISGKLSGSCSRLSPSSDGWLNPGVSASMPPPDRVSSSRTLRVVCFPLRSFADTVPTVCAPCQELNGAQKLR